MNIPPHRERDLTVIHAVMVCILILIILQFLLLMVAVDALLAGHLTILFPATLGSGVCFLGACWLVRYVVAQRRPE